SPTSYTYVGAGQGNYTMTPLQQVAAGLGDYIKFPVTHYVPSAVAGSGDWTPVPETPTSYTYVGAGQGNYTMTPLVYYGAGLGDHIKYPFTRYMLSAIPGKGDWTPVPESPTSYIHVGAGQGNYTMTPLVYYGAGLGDHIKYPFTRYVPSATPGTGDWTPVPETPTSYIYVGAGEGNYTMTPLQQVAAGLGDHIKYPFTRYVPSATPGTGDWTPVPETPTSYTYVGAGEGNYTMTPLQQVSAGLGDHIKFPVTHYVPTTTPGTGDWTPTIPTSYSYHAGVGNYTMAPNQYVNDNNGDQKLIWNYFDLVTLGASMTGAGSFTGTIDGTCTFSSVPVIPDKTLYSGGQYQGGSAPGWYNFSCTTNKDVQHNETWSGSIAVTTGTPWNHCPLPGFSNSYVGILPQTTLSDAFSAVDDPAICIEYTNATKVPSPATPW
ncbi:MAG: hypothetical protein OEZ16_09945, partial [Chromatiales bacterium]|nr:hypothetical protein [Chromatiales bacterium]